MKRIAAIFLLLVAGIAAACSSSSAAPSPTPVAPSAAAAPAAPAASGPFARGFGHGGAGGAMNQTAILDAAATALKADPQTLQQEIAALTQGQDLRTIAAAHGVDYATLTAAIHAAVKAQLDAAVAKGTLTAAQETTLLGRADQQLAAGRLPFAGFGRRGSMAGGRGGPTPSQPVPAPSSAA